MDIGRTIRDVFQDQLELYDGSLESSSVWFERAACRQTLFHQYCWSEEMGLFYDYDLVLKQQNRYDSATVFFALWSGIASHACASRIVYVLISNLYSLHVYRAEGLKKFEVKGGLVSGTEASRGDIHMNRPNRQWDYPFGTFILMHFDNTRMGAAPDRGMERISGLRIPRPGLPFSLSLALHHHGTSMHNYLFDYT
jgi:alpha,alpha-trehalase